MSPCTILIHAFTAWDVPLQWSKSRIPAWEAAIKHRAEDFTAREVLCACLPSRVPACEQLFEFLRRPFPGCEVALKQLIASFPGCEQLIRVPELGNPVLIRALCSASQQNPRSGMCALHKKHAAHGSQGTLSKRSLFHSCMSQALAHHLRPCADVQPIQPKTKPSPPSSRPPIPPPPRSRTAS